MRIVSSDGSVLVAKDLNVTPIVIGAAFAVTGLVAIIKPDIFIEEIPLWLSAILVALGVLAVLATTSYKVVCDLNNKVVRVADSSIIKKDEVEIGFDEIDSIQLRQSEYTYYTANGLRHEIRNVAYIVMENGRQVQISNDTTTGSGILLRLYYMLRAGKETPMQSSLTNIAEFIGKPFEIPRQHSAKEVLDAVKHTIARTAI